MRKLRVWAFRLATRLMAFAGDVGSAEWSRMVAENKRYEKNYIEADKERWVWIEDYHKLLKTVKLVDGLMSQKQYDHAQEQLRLTLISQRSGFGRNPFAADKG